MEVRTIDRAANGIAEHKLLIIRQRQLAAELARKGQHECARRARTKLLQLMNQYDLMREMTERNLQSDWVSAPPLHP